MYLLCIYPSIYPTSKSIHTYWNFPFFLFILHLFNTSLSSFLWPTTELQLMRVIRSYFQTLNCFNTTHEFIYNFFFLSLVLRNGWIYLHFRLEHMVVCSIEKITKIINISLISITILMITTWNYQFPLKILDKYLRNLFW